LPVQAAILQWCISVGNNSEFLIFISTAQRKATLALTELFRTGQEESILLHHAQPAPP